MTEDHMVLMNLKCQRDMSLIEDTLIDALESGSRYWVSIRKLVNRKPERDHGTATYMPAYVTTPLSYDGVLVLFDQESEEELELTRKKIMAGLKTMLIKYPKHFGNLISREGDAETADVLLQCALFDEIKYG